MIAVLAGGVGAARLLRGLVRTVDPASITAVVNVADDLVLHGLHISPDLDTVTYTLAGAVDAERGWGLTGETWQAMAALERFGAPTWFNLGDRDLATHLHRTGRLADGATLSTVTAEIARSWGLDLTLLPVSDDPVRTRVVVVDPDGPPEGTEVGFQEYFVQRHHDVPVRAVRFEGAAEARPAPGVLDALADAEVVIIAPSNPVVSIGPLLAVPGVADALAARRRSVVAVSPLVAGAALKGPADRLMADLGQEPSAVGVARAYAEVAGALVIDHADAELAGAGEQLGLRCTVTDTIMADAERAEALARTTLDAAR